MKRALMTLTGVALLGIALPAVAGQPIGWHDSRIAPSINAQRQAFPNQPAGASEPAAAPYALTGSSDAASSAEGWSRSVETVGRERRTIYTR